MTTGTQLQQARMAKKLSLADVTRSTKIQPWVLEAIESDKLTGMMSPIYVRGFISTYARFLQVDAAPLLAGLKWPAPDPVLAEAELPPPSPSTRLTFTLPKAELPKVQLPKLALPKVELPKLRLPTMQMPSVELPRIPLSALKRAGLGLAAVAAVWGLVWLNPAERLSKITLPSIAVPKLALPKLALPKLALPTFAQAPAGAKPEAKKAQSKKPATAAKRPAAPAQPVSVAAKPAGPEAKPVAVASAPKPTQPKSTAAAPAKPAGKSKVAAAQKTKPAAADASKEAAAAKPAGPVLASVAPMTEPVQLPAPEPLSVVSAQPLELRVTANKTTWIKVRADGKLLTQQRLPRGANERWVAKKQFELVIAKPTQVELTLNGQPISPFAVAHKGRILITHRGVTQLPEDE
jgi:cytoskeletal protein RodZ